MAREIARCPEGGRDTPLRPPQPLLTGETRATVTIMTGLQAGRIEALLRNPIILGRSPDADLFFDDAALSRRHARIVRNPRSGSSYDWRVEDLGSTNGTYVCGRRIEAAVLSSGDHIQLGPNVLLRFDLYDAQDETLQRRLFESAIHDPLTGAHNRAHFGAHLASELSYARRTGRGLALLMLDVDHFKQVNDDLGHIAGDQVLRAIAKQIQQIVRTEDAFARYGGDEFVILLRDSGTHEATQVGLRLRDMIRSTSVRHGRLALSVSVSIGVVSIDDLSKRAGAADVVARADARMYRAKLAGRDRVCAAD